MKYSVVFILVALAITGCKKSGDNKTSGGTDSTVSTVPTTSEADEQTAIKKVIAEFQSGYSEKNWTRIQPLLSKNFNFFGTDSAEVISGVNGFMKQMSDDWMVMDSVKFGQVRNFSMILGNDHSVASVIYEVPFSGKAGGQPMNVTARFAQTFRKEEGNWKMAQGVVAIATTGQSSAALAAQMK